MNMKRFVLSFFLLLLCNGNAGPVYAQALEEVTTAPLEDQKTALQEDEQDKNQNQDEAKSPVEKINEVMRKIYDRVVAEKEKYKELADFNEKNLVLDSNGFLTIEYEMLTPSSRGQTFRYAFKLAVEPLKKSTARKPDIEGYFDYPMPFLDLQFSGYMVKHPLRRQFDFQRVFDEVAEEMIDYQQQFMPLQFMILADRTTFKVKEPIRFKAVLVNVSEHHILVKSLGQESLFFTLNRNAWGTQAGNVQVMDTPAQRYQQRQEERKRRAEMRQAMRNNSGQQTTFGKRTQVGDQLILRAGEALTIDFEGDGYSRAQDVDIRGIYQLSIKGIRPTGKIKLKIVDD